MTIETNTAIDGACKSPVQLLEEQIMRCVLLLEEETKKEVRAKSKFDSQFKDDYIKKFIELCREHKAITGKYFPDEYKKRWHNTSSIYSKQ